MKLVITEPAKFRLKEIHDYYKYRAGIRVADKIKTGIIQKVKFLQKHPAAGAKEEILASIGLSHQRFVEGNYKIIYRIVDDTIYVTDIFDARQNPDKMLI